MKIPEPKNGCNFLMVGINQIEIEGYPDLYGELEATILTKPEAGDSPVSLQLTIVPRKKEKSHFLPENSTENPGVMLELSTIQIYLSESQAVLLGEFLQMATNVEEEDD